MKIKLGVIFGGKSVEHEISIITANQAMEGLNKDKYEIIPIYIAKNSLFYTGEALLQLEEYKDIGKLIQKCTQIVMMNDGNKVNLLRYPAKKLGGNIINFIDIAFPIMHGTNGEDGTIQGYLQMLNIPYVGPDIVSSSIGMDKIAMRRILKEANLPVLNYVTFYSMEYVNNEEKYIKLIEEKLEFPVIVKPGNLGSSVGIKIAHNKAALQEAIDYSCEFSDRIIVEKCIKNLREINCSVLGDMINATASVCEEPLNAGEILSYTDKYVQNNGSKGSKIGGSKANSQGMASLQRELPANIPEELSSKIQTLAIETFKVLGESGVSRIDFLLDADTNSIYVNEINTIPGALSFYLWEATGKSFDKQLDEMIELAFKRERLKSKITYSYEQNILSLTSGSKISKSK